MTIFSRWLDRWAEARVAKKAAIPSEDGQRFAVSVDATEMVQLGLLLRWPVFPRTEAGRVMKIQIARRS